MSNDKKPEQEKGKQKSEKELGKAEQKPKEPDTGFFIKGFIEQSEVRLTKIELTLAELKKAADRSAQLEEKINILLQEIGGVAAQATPAGAEVAPAAATGATGEHLTTTEIPPAGPSAPPVAPALTPPATPGVAYTPQALAPAPAVKWWQNPQTVGMFLDKVFAKGPGPAEGSEETFFKRMEMYDKFIERGRKESMDSFKLALQIVRGQVPIVTLPEETLPGSRVSGTPPVVGGTGPVGFAPHIP